MIDTMYVRVCIRVWRVCMCMHVYVCACVHGMCVCVCMMCMCMCVHVCMACVYECSSCVCVHGGVHDVADADSVLDMCVHGDVCAW